MNKPKQESKREQVASELEQLAQMIRESKGVHSYIYSPCREAIEKPRYSYGKDGSWQHFAPSPVMDVSIKIRFEPKDLESDDCDCTACVLRRWLLKEGCEIDGESLLKAHKYLTEKVEDE